MEAASGLLKARIWGWLILLVQADLRGEAIDNV
jgi:hypothetical protein